MIADIDGVLERAMGVRGERRFYPAGAHPATFKLREHLFALERQRDAVVGYRSTSPDGYSVGHLDLVDAAIEHDREQIARFERGHDREKAIYLLGYLERRCSS